MSLSCTVFNIPTSVWRPCLGWSHWNFTQIFGT